MLSQQTFQHTDQLPWQVLDPFPGAQILSLAEPVPHGSIHRLKMAAGTIIPIHTHPCDEYVYVFSGVIETGGQRCESSTFWHTPAGVKQGPHEAITDVELLTIRLGVIGNFDDLSGRI